MTRRDLMRLLLASAIAEVVDVERLLWTPKPIVTVPALPRMMFHRDAFTLTMETLVDGTMSFGPITRYDVLWGVATVRASA